MSAFIDHTDERFGKLVAKNVACKNNGKVYWTCECDCGRKVTVNAYRLTHGDKTSCGCERHYAKRLGNVNKLLTDDLSTSLTNILEYYHSTIQSMVDKFYESHEMGILDKEDLWQFCRIGILKCIQNSNEDKTDIARLFRIYAYNQMIRGWISSSSVGYGLAQEYRYNATIINNIITENETEVLDEDTTKNKEMNIEVSYYMSDLFTKIKELITEKQFDILYRHHCQGESLDDIAKEYKVTRQRIHQIEQEIMFSLKNNDELKDLYDIYTKLS